jgi:hypothetical protein
LEGIHVQGSSLSFVSKTFQTMFVLDLDMMAYVNHTMTNGLVHEQTQPQDPIVNMRNEEETTTTTTATPYPQPLQPDTPAFLTYLTADNEGRRPGVHARTTTHSDIGGQFQYLTILYSEEYDDDESTGLSFSPNGKFMYVAYRDHGVLFEIQRTDGHPFHAKPLNIMYQQQQHVPP